MRRSILLCSIVGLLALAPVPGHAASADAGQRVAQAQAQTEALRGQPEKLKFRHNIQRVIRAWARAVAGAEGDARLLAEARKGEADAWALMAHWSGRSDDQRQADALKAALEAAPAQPEAVVAVVRAVALKERPDGLVIDLGVADSVQVERRALPAKAGRPARVYFDLRPVKVDAAALGAVALKHPGVAEARLGQFDDLTARLVLELDTLAPDAVQAEGTRVVVRVPRADAPLAARDEPAVTSGEVALETALARLEAKAEPAAAKTAPRSAPARSGASPVAAAAARPAAEVAQAEAGPVASVAATEVAVAEAGETVPAAAGKAAPAKTDPAATTVTGATPARPAVRAASASLSPASAAPPAPKAAPTAQTAPRPAADVAAADEKAEAAAVLAAAEAALAEAARTMGVAEPALEVSGARARSTHRGPEQEVAPHAPPAKVAEAAASAPQVQDSLPKPPQAEVAQVQGPLRRSTREAAQPRTASLLTIRKVVIDAGHGGKDEGAVGPGGVKEKAVNLAIAKQVGEALKARLGVEVVYTRTDDCFVSLEQRARIANRHRADLFISVHANAHRKHRVHGIETYYLNTTSSRYARKLARRENLLSKDGVDGPEPDEVVEDEEEVASLPEGELGQDVKLILADLAMRSASLESRRLAGYVQKSMVGRMRRDYEDVKDLGVKHALFYVLLGVRMPAVLIETGFVSHKEESQRLADAKYQDQLARAIAQGVVRFAQEREQLAAALNPGAMELASN